MDPSEHPLGASAHLSSKRIGPYHLLAALSEGGIAQLFVARREGAFELCVLKRLKLSMLSQKLAHKRLVREANVASMLDHPNVAGVIDAGFEGDDFYIAMELIRGQDLDALFRGLQTSGSRLPPDLAVGVALSILDGLEYAHAFQDPQGTPLNIVHRDLSMRNVLISYQGQIKIIDFGVAKVSAKEALTASGALIGTPRYMSPEQALGERVDHRSDLYSLSVVLYELLTGEALIRAKRALDALQQVVQLDPPAVHTRARGVPVALSQALEKGLCKEREGRWLNATLYKEALIAAVGGRPKTRPALEAMMAELFTRARVGQEAQLEKLLIESERVSQSSISMSDAVRAPTVSSEYEPDASEEPTGLAPRSEEVMAPTAFVDPPARGASYRGPSAEPAIEQPGRGRLPMWAVVLILCLSAALAFSLGLNLWFVFTE